MRILLAAKHAPHGARPIGGVQSWCRTVCRELERRGYDVETWGPEQFFPAGEFDLGIVANIHDTHKALAQCRKLIVVSHGIIPAENPHLKNSRAQLVFTSEEIRDHWDGIGQIVRQPIDLDFWVPAHNRKESLTRFSYRRGLNFVKGIARSMQMKYVHLHNKSSRECREVLQNSACVLATGRAALEAMACGVPVVLLDHRGAYQPALLHTDIPQAAKRNYSGRGGITPTILNTREAIDRAITRGNMRKYVKKYHDVVHIVDQLMDIATLRRGTL